MTHTYHYTTTCPKNSLLPLFSQALTASDFTISVVLPLLSCPTKLKACDPGQVNFPVPQSPCRKKCLQEQIHPPERFRVISGAWPGVEDSAHAHLLSPTLLPPPWAGPWGHAPGCPPLSVRESSSHPSASQGPSRAYTLCPALRPSPTLAVTLAVPSLFSLLGCMAVLYTHCCSHPIPPWPHPSWGLSSGLHWPSLSWFPSDPQRLLGRAISQDPEIMLVIQNSHYICKHPCGF